MKKAAVHLAIFLAAIVCWSAISDNPSVWPVRNTLEYRATRAWWAFAGEPERRKFGGVGGLVASKTGAPIQNAVVLLSEWDGSVHAARTDATGRYRITDIPVGFYRIAATAPGHVSVQSSGLFRGVSVRPGGRAEASFSLNPSQKNELPPLPPPRATELQTLACKSPVPGEASREVLVFDEAGFKEPVFLYRPTDSAGRAVPVLLTIYPGPVDTWECVSIGLAQAGYAVVALGPSYGLELNGDVDFLERLTLMIKKGGIAGADRSRVAALGGSYSALLLELLMLRDPGLDAVVLLGPPTDMFDFRRRFEREGFLPPFGLDKALVALGLPSRDPLRYLKYSMVYHVRQGLPAMILFHSYQDEIVPYQQSGLLAESLRGAGVEAELVLFDGASHYLLEDGEAAMAIYRQTLGFLRRQGMPPFPGKE